MPTFFSMAIAGAALLLGAAASAAAPSEPDLSPHAWVVIDDPVQFKRPAPRGSSSESDEGQAADEVSSRSAAGSEAGSESESRSEPNRSTSVLLHIPPRIPVAGATPAPDLRVARIARLPVAPEWLIPVGNTVYAVMPADDQGVHRVGRSRVYPRGLRDLWGADPARRLEVLPAIAGTVRAVSTDGESPLAVLQTETGLQIVRLDGAEWLPVAELLEAQPAAHVGLMIRGDQLSIMTITDATVTWATHDAAGWESSSHMLTDDLAANEIRILGPWNGEIIAFAHRQDRPDQPARVVALASGATRQVGQLPVPVTGGSWQSAAILADPGRLVLVSTGAEATEDASTALPSPGIKQRVVAVAEFSLVTGTLLALGEATASSPVSRGEFQSLALLLVAGMILVLVVVVRPTPTSVEPVLPPGTAIAPTGRRLVSSLSDLFPSLFVTGAVLDITPLETLGPIALPITGSVDVMPLLMVLSITSMHCAIGEMLTGRSLGKMLTGTFVARVDPVPGTSPEAGRFRPPTPGGALLRNIMKWFLFPATAIVLSDPSGRHRGDLIARSAVLMPVSQRD